MTTETAKRTIEANALRLSSGFVERQRDAIELIHQSTIATLRLAEAMSHAQNPSQAADARPHHRRGRPAALHNAALDFFHSALSLIGAMANAGPAARSAQAPFRRDAGESPTAAPRLAALTLQQRRVLSLLMTGLTNKLIAYQLGVTEPTVKAHVSQLLLKFNVHSRAQIMARMSRPGLERLN